MAREDLFVMSEELAIIYRTMEMDIFLLIIEMLDNAEGIEDIHQWQRDMFSQTTSFNDDLAIMIAVYTAIMEQATNDSIQNVFDIALKDVDDRVVAHLGDKPTNIKLDDVIKQGFEDQIFRPSINGLPNFVNQTLLGTHYGGGMAEYVFTDIINKTTRQFVYGDMKFHKALEKTILDWVDSGISGGFIDKGGNLWSLERYINTVLRSTLSNVYNAVHLSRMEEYGIHTVLMSSIIDSAPRCIECQGEVLDMRPVGQVDSNYKSIYEFGYGTPGGTLGINCRHSVWAFIPGVHTNTQPQFDPKETESRSKDRARQRELERRIRETKKKMIIYEHLGMKPELKSSSMTLALQQDQIDNLLKDCNWLRRNYNNERVYTPKELLIKEFKINQFANFGERGYSERWTV